MAKQKILDRYIYHEMLPPFILTLTVLLLVLFLNKIFRLADLVVSKGATVLSILQVFAYIIPSFLGITIPMALVVAALIAFARLSSDSEITAMKASCIRLTHMVRPVVYFALACFMVTTFTSLVLAPGAEAALKEHLFNMVKSRAMVGIEPGVFTTTFDGMVVYVEKMESLDKLQGIFIADERSVKEPYAIVARYGKLSADPKSMNVTLSMQEGSIHVKPKDDQTYTIMGFDAGRLYLDINNALAQKGPARKGYRDYGTLELLREIRQLRSEGKPAHSPEAELHKRLSIPFSCLILGLIGAPLGIRRNRSGKSAGIFIALMVFLVYYIIVGTAGNLAETGIVRPALAYWTPNILMLLAAGFFVYIKEREISFNIGSRISMLYYDVKALATKDKKPL